MLDIIATYLGDADSLLDYFKAAGGVVLAVSAITAITPTKVDDNILGGLGKVYNIIAKVLNVASINVLYNKNEDA